MSSLEPYFLYNSIVHAPLVAPMPILFIHGTKDTALLPEFAQKAHDAAPEPNELVWIETHNHIELYDQDPYVAWPQLKRYNGFRGISGAGNVQWYGNSERYS